MSQKQFKKILPLLQWKLEKKQFRIDENQIAKYADMSQEEAEETLDKLLHEHIVYIDIKANCPQCLTSYSVDNAEKEIICMECGFGFVPKNDKHLLHYYYMLNQNCKAFNIGTKEDKPRRGLFAVAQKKLGEQEAMNKKVKVFLSYSHVDEKYKEELDKHFAALKRSDKVETWNDRKLLPGCKLDDDIKKHLGEDDIIILLISSDFIASDYCYNIEMCKAIERSQNQECIVIPIIVRPCLWTETPLKDILALPKDGKPISQYADSDEAYLEVVSAVNKMLVSSKK